MKRRVTILIGGARNTTDYDEVLKRAKLGGTIPWGTRTKELHPGETVLIYIARPHSKIVAKAKVLQYPKKGASGGYAYRVEIGAFKRLPNQVTLKDLRGHFKKWKWLRQPRAAVAVPKEFLDKLWSLIHSKPSRTKTDGRQIFKRYTAELSSGALDHRSESKLRQAVENLQASDRRREVLQRTEQSLLREHLFGMASTGQCGICNREFPVTLLVAAHIKPRSQCTSKERNDYQNNIMPMCKFGCDDLFEKSYISVHNGRIKSTTKAASSYTHPIKKYLRAITGLQCRYWRPTSVFYFNWHNKKCQKMSRRSFTRQAKQRR